MMKEHVCFPIKKTRISAATIFIQNSTERFSPYCEVTTTTTKGLFHVVDIEILRNLK